MEVWFEIRVLTSGRKRYWSAITFSRSAQGAARVRNPFTLWAGRAGACTGDSRACTIEKKALKGVGLSLVSGTHVAGEMFDTGGFMIGQ